MEPTDAEHQDPLEGVPKLESITANQGFLPDFLFFWERWTRKPPAAP